MRELIASIENKTDLFFILNKPAGAAPPRQKAFLRRRGGAAPARRMRRRAPASGARPLSMRHNEATTFSDAARFFNGCRHRLFGEFPCNCPVFSTQNF